MKIKTLQVAALVAFAIATPASSDTQTDSCLSPLTQFDICAFATEMQQGISPHLPQQVSSDVVLDRVIVLGPEIAFYMVWQMTDAEFEQRLAENGKTSDMFADEMTAASRNTVCGQEVTAAFTRLGGTVQYFYQTIDGTVISQTTISNCL